MQALRARDVPAGERMRLGAQAGLAGGVAFLAAMALDLVAARNGTNDLRMLAGVVPGGERRWRLVGTALHFFNSAVLGAVYGRFRPRLIGPGWIAGLFFSQVENVAAWPMMILLDRINPAIRSGRVPRYNRPIPFLQEMFRHAAYGIVLGAVFDRLIAATRNDDD